MNSSYQVTTLQQRPDLEPQIDRLSQTAWPEFMLHGNMRYWASLFSTFAAYQILLCDPQDAVIAVGHTIPFPRDGSLGGLPTDMDSIMVRGMQAFRSSQPCTALSALAAIVDPNRQGQGLSAAVLKEMKALATSRGLASLLAPVRPTWKSRYPLTPMERYVAWKRPDTAPFDPWLRVHWRLGASFLQVMPQAFVVQGSVAEWEQWAGMPFPESGEYIVSGALAIVTIDCERDSGRYVEPNVWMEHKINQDQETRI